MGKTKIICTIGPASETEETLKKMIGKGMNICRCNFSHGSYEEHGAKFDLIKKIRKEMNIDLPIALDTKGPDIRLKTFKNDEGVTLQEGAKFSLYTDIREGDINGVSVTHKDLHNRVKKGDEVLIFDGRVKLVVDSVVGTEIICTVVIGGYIYGKRNVHVPGVALGLQFISDIDRQDLEFGVSQNVDMIFASFVDCANDVLEMRKIVGDIKIIAKIESVNGINNIDEIIKVADGVMVARGDLGVEYAVEKIPALQKMIIKKCKAAGRFVITATEMMESMKDNPRPTRAEVSDVFNAIMDGTDAIMLSAESAMGKFPVETVDFMRRTANEAELELQKNAK